ncbi:MAG: bifunctional phosphopantothenoylcysteine decarboxylase/phosphopantothenate--cysteine ligase CoaBC [Thermosynechococcaceae cyanobacterium]
MAQRILIGIGGGIAAYKVCEIISALVKSGSEVRVMLTGAAQAFVTPLTVTTLCRHPVYDDASLWEATHQRPLHIELADWADLMLLAPLTANTLAKLACGLADNLLSNTVLASDCPILLAPAMNTTMWQQPAVQRNWRQILQEARYHVIGPGAGLLACDTVGLGRMAEPQDILSYLSSLEYTKGCRDLVDKTLLISAGGTREPLDPVRFIGNPSTGKMGMALALAAWHRGAKVSLVHAPLSEIFSPVADINKIATPTSAEMRSQLLNLFPTADWTIMAAAVGDVKPAQYSATKLPKKDLPQSLALEPVPDILAELSQLKQPRQRLIGFAAQTGDIVTPAQEKLKRKGLDAIATNPVDQPHSGFGSHQNQAVLIDKTGRQVEVPNCSKLSMAHQLLDFIVELDQRLVHHPAP